MNQTTLKRSYTFTGKGLHTGVPVTMTVKPAAAGTGIIFKRTDISDDAIIEALSANVSRTDRSTTISSNGYSVSTIEHLMSAFAGLGVDNALVELDNIEVPILDGSASRYVAAISADGLQELDAPRKEAMLTETVEVRDEKTGAFVKIEPAGSPSYELTVDFNSKVLGVQTATWAPEQDFCSQIAPCRTFCFFHEIEFLAANNLIKGGDVDNAIVIVEHPVTDAQLDNICRLFGKQKIGITSSGYLDNVALHFPNECGRHKLLDLIGDLRLAGPVNAKVTAYKPGHTINAAASKALAAALEK